MIKAVIFDVDGTLLDTERLYMQAWVEAGAAFGYTVPHEALMQTRAVRRTVAMEVFRKYCGADFPYDEILKERVRLAEIIIENTPADKVLMPYTKKLLSWLRQKGIKIAAATSTGKEKTDLHLAHVGLQDAFDIIVCGDMVAKGKPDPDIFLEAARRLQVSVDEAIVVGDTPADVFAGSAAGIRVVLIPDQVPANEQTSPLCWKILKDLSQVPDVITAQEG